MCMNSLAGAFWVDYTCAWKSSNSLLHIHAKFQLLFQDTYFLYLWKRDMFSVLDCYSLQYFTVNPVLCTIGYYAHFALL